MLMQCSPNCFSAIHDVECTHSDCHCHYFIYAQMGQMTHKFLKSILHSSDFNLIIIQSENAVQDILLLVSASQHS